ncbi:MAG: hypothetical protein AVO38_14285 [delta proteobacterium ML8_D]|jgi:hypothetical protein|nr:MAG: hypothetical protein AVO38_14285 [delta proteobacterium ML8_D]
MDIDFAKLAKLPYISKRMFVIGSICKKRNVDLEYLFGLMSLYNEKNRGKWFWQKATFTGALKETYENFNKKIDGIVRSLKSMEESSFLCHVEDGTEILERFLTGMEANCEVDRDAGYRYVKGLLDNNLKKIIEESTRSLKKHGII